MKLHKTEAVGIFMSIGFMVIALFLLRVHNSTFAVKKLDTTQAAAVAVVDTHKDTQSSQEALRTTLSDSLASDGTLKKMVIKDVLVGTGPAVKKGDTISVQYIGTLQNGQQFDNSYKRGAPFTFTVGEGRVIKGWDQGVVDMHVGGKRILVIPAKLAYGSRAVGTIPANSTLIFAIELLKIN